MSKLFGTDGVRGLANAALTPELAFQLGLSAAEALVEPGHRPFVLIGRDTRASGEMLEAALAAGFCAAGVDVCLGGVLPTPAVAWLARRQGAAAAAVISASHNPAPDNGIKFFSAEGTKLPDAVENRIEETVRHSLANVPRPTGEGIGRIRHVNWVDDYARHAIQSAQAELRGLKLLIDTGHGAQYHLAPQVLETLGLEVEVLHDRPDGHNINRDCGSTHLKHLQAMVVAGGFDLGIAFDGDGDRMLAVDHTGQSIDGDQVMFICARFLPSLQANRTLVATVMSNMGFENAVRALGLDFRRAKVGDRYVLELMSETGALLGGEQSGHLIFPQFNTTGDGLISAVQLLSAVKLAGRDLGELAAEMPLYPQILVNVRVARTANWDANPAIREAIQAAESTLADNGRVLVRASGTEPLIRVMLEGSDAGEVETLAHRIADTVRSELTS